MSTATRSFTSGHVARVELDNFKSWKGKQTIGPFHAGFTAVIGPNGAGKSNLMDSISFVTGIKAKRLRGDQLRDLVYDADKLAQQENRHMSVSIAYQLGENELPQYRAGEELVFKRTVQYAHPGCEYYIGHRRVTYDEYERVFAQLNILTQARNFLIFQGDVEATAAKSPAELALLFEQISGSEAHKPEYDRLERERDRLDQATLDRIAHSKLAKQEKKEAKEQKDATDRFHVLERKRDQIQVDFALFQVQQCTQQVQLARTDKLQRARDELDECSTLEQSSLEDANAQRATVALDTRAVAKAESALAAVNKTKLAAQAAYSKKSEASQRERTKLVGHRDAEKQAGEALERQLAEQRDLEQQIAVFTSKEEELAGELSKKDEQPGQDEQEEDAGLRAEAEEATRELRTEESACKLRVDTLQGRLALAQSNHEQLASRCQEAQAAHQEWAKKAQLAEKRLGELQHAQTQAERAQHDRQRQQEANAALVEHKQRELHAARQVLGASQAKSTETARTRKLKDTVAALASHFPGVRGRLVDLVRPTAKKYALAVDTCLGRHMDSVVIDSKHVAFECMKYLRDNRLGTATFLPLDALQPKPISEHKRKLTGSGGGGGGKFSLCYDLIVVEDEAVALAARFAAGDAIVCDTLEDARRLCFQQNVRVKAVTLEGHVISQRGEMTGGAMGGGDGNKQDRFALAQAKQAKDTCDRLEREVAELEATLQHMDTSGTSSSSEVLNCVNRVKFCQVNVKEFADKAGQSKARAEEYTLESAAAKFKLGQVEDELRSAQQALRAVRERIAQAELAVLGGGDGEEEEDNSRHSTSKRLRLAQDEREERQRHQQELRQVKDHLNKLQSHLRFLTSKNRQQQVDQARELAQECEQTIAKYEAEAQEAKAKLDQATAAAQQHEDALRQCQLKLAQAEARLKDVQQHLAELVESKSKALRDVSAAEGEVQRAQAKLDDTVKQAALDGITLPKQTQDEAEEFDFAQLASSKLKSDSEFANKLREIREELAQLQPNARADQRYAEASERAKESDAQLHDSRELSRQAEEEFAGVRAQRRTAFVDMFTHVAGKIDQVYKELTKRPNAPLGGSAFLALEDEEGAFTSGIKFECMPPNKRYRQMEQLSGGEKTIAALALLFAIHTYRPSPFFVLDEVDAALDNDNVERVSNYIRMRSTARGTEGEGGEELFRPFQCLVISLKDGFFGKAESLVGVYRDLANDTSRALTLDLGGYGAD